MVNDRVNIAKRLRKTPEELAKENFYDDASYKIEPLLFEMVYEIVCGSDEGSYDDVFIKAAELIDPFKFLKNVPIFEIENMQLYVYMPPVDDFGNLQIGDDRIGYVDVTVEITVITVDMSSEDFEKCTKAIFAAIWSSGIETGHERIDDLGEVDEPCTIVTSIDERSEGTTVYGYKDIPKSQVTRNSIPLTTEHNKELARRLYCGKVWTCDVLKFAETYYEHRD